MNEQAHSLISNTWYSFLTQGIRISTNLLIFIYLARVLGIEDFGKFMFAITFSGLFLYFADFGLDRIAIIEVARDHKSLHSYFYNIIASKLVLAIIMFSLVYVIINLMGYPSETRNLVYLLSLSFIIFSITGIFNAVFKGFERLGYETLTAFFTNFILLSTIFLFTYLDYAVLSIGVSFIISRIFGLICAVFILYVKIDRPMLSINYDICIKVIKKALPFALLTGVSAILLDIDTVLLSFIKGNESVGYYQASMRIVAALTVIPMILDGSFFPHLSKLHNRQDEFVQSGHKLLTIICFIGIPLTSFILFIPDKIIFFLFGHNFFESVFVLQILSFMLILRFIGRGYEVILLSTGKQINVFYVFFSATMFNIFLNIFMITLFDFFGAAYAAVISHSFIFITFAFLVRKQFKTLFLEKNVIIIFLLSLVSILSIYSVRSLNLFILLTIFSSIYLSTSFFFLKKERVFIFGSLFSSFKNSF